MRVGVYFDVIRANRNLLKSRELLSGNIYIVRATPIEDWMGRAVLITDSPWGDDALCGVGEVKHRTFFNDEKWSFELMGRGRMDITVDY